MFESSSLPTLRELIESLKRYNRYELNNDNGKSLLKEVYVDPLPDEGVLKLALNNNTCFITGRKGTGKSTVFLMAQETLRSSKNKIGVYIDVKTIYGQSVLSRLEVRKYSDALGVEAVEALMCFVKPKYPLLSSRIPHAPDGDFLALFHERVLHSVALSFE